MLLTEVVIVVFVVWYACTRNKGEVKKRMRCTAHLFQALTLQHLHVRTYILNARHPCLTCGFCWRSFSFALQTAHNHHSPITIRLPNKSSHNAITYHKHIYTLLPPLFSSLTAPALHLLHLSSIDTNTNTSITWIPHSALNLTIFAPSKESLIRTHTTTQHILSITNLLPLRNLPGFKTFQIHLSKTQRQSLRPWPSACLASHDCWLSLKRLWGWRETIEMEVDICAVTIRHTG